MAIRVKSQKNYYLSEICIEVPTDIGAIADLMRALKSTGRIVATYNQGGVMMVNIEQKTRIGQSHDEQVRELLGICTRTYD